VADTQAGTALSSRIQRRFADSGFQYNT